MVAGSGTLTESSSSNSSHSKAAGQDAVPEPVRTIAATLAKSTLLLCPAFSKISKGNKTNCMYKGMMAVLKAWCEQQWEWKEAEQEAADIPMAWAELEPLVGSKCFLSFCACACEYLCV